MALTESKIKDLTDKKFDELYAQNEKEWLKLAATAHAFAKANITGGKEPRPDDIAKALFPMLQVHDVLRAHQEDNSARAKRFVEWFVEYVIDEWVSQKEAKSGAKAK